jgi:hypothetical protein
MLLIFISISPKEKKVGLLKDLKMFDLSRPFPEPHYSLLSAHLGVTKIQEFKIEYFGRPFEHLILEIQICFAFGNSNFEFYRR